MTDHGSQYRRWAELMDRRDAGDALSQEELALCERLASVNPACARELELLAELAHLDAAPTAESSALVDATLQAMAEAAQHAETAELSQLKRGNRVPRMVFVLGAAAAAAMAAAMVVTFAVVPRQPVTEGAPQAVVPPTTRIELVYTAGEILVDGKPSTGGSALLTEGSRVAVLRGSACIAMDPGIDVCLGDDTELVLSRTRGAWRKLDLVRGRVGAQLLPQPEGSHFSIVADGVWSTAVGTAFTVERGQDRDVRTTVMHGRVRVGSDGGREDIVVAHQRVEVRGGRATVTALGRNEESPAWALLRPTELWRNPVSATLNVRGIDSHVEVLLDSQAIGLAPLSTLVPAGAHVVQLRVGDRIAATREIVAEVGQVSTLDFDLAELSAPSPEQPVAEVAAQTVQRSTSSKPSVSDMLAEARRLLRSGSFEAAAAQYTALRAAYPQSSEAEAVLVSLAELELDRLGRPERALVDLERYLVGGGALSEEARFLRIRALRSLSQEDAERRAIEEFLSTHPGSFRRSALVRRRDELGAAR